MTFKAAIVGRPNVGKSTLFNRLSGKHLAIVDDTPGVTRDWREGSARLGGMAFGIIDTAGLDEAEADSLEAAMLQQTDMALDEADVALFLFDARAGITPRDKHFANWLRRKGKPVILVANKCEGASRRADISESYGLGFGDPIPISAAHGEGLGDLFDALEPFSNLTAEPNLEEDDAPELDDDSPLRLAIVGRPNVGKSTLVNQIIGEERMLTGPEAGVTRDSISVSWMFEGRAIKLVDTAGLRRKSKVREKLENLSVRDSLRAIRYAQIVVLVLDAVTGQDDAVLEKQDLTIARHVIDEGRGLIIAINKWDLVKNKKEVLKSLSDRLERSLPQVRGIPTLSFSALNGKGLKKLLPAVFKTYDLWNKRIPTGPLNRWLEMVSENHPPPLSQARRIRLRYITQAKTRPPTFAVFVSRPVDLPDSYLRYLVNTLRDDFDLPGVPLRIYARKGKNPYAKE
jgi:GTPase